LTITALGTSFNVRTYAEESKIYVALEEGKVSVEKNAPADDDVMVFLDPGEIVAYDIRSEKISPKNKLVFEEHFGWKNGLLLFNEDNLSEVIKKLERWYGVEFVILNQDRSAGWRYKGRFNNESLTNVLRGLSDTKSFDYEIQEKTVYIRFNS
jgi:transmembrane sensor